MYCSGSQRTGPLSMNCFANSSELAPRHKTGKAPRLRTNRCQVSWLWPQHCGRVQLTVRRPSCHGTGTRHHVSAPPPEVTERTPDRLCWGCTHRALPELAPDGYKLSRTTQKPRRPELRI